jgi:hypothetical protein
MNMPSAGAGHRHRPPGARFRPVARAGLAYRAAAGRRRLVLAVAPMLREVRAMGLTWRDLASSVAVLVMVLAYWSFVYQSGVPLLRSAWATSAVELILGCACAVTAAADLHTRPQQRAGRIARRITTVLGAIALLAGLAGLAANSGQAVEILVVATVFLWLTATISHVLTIGAEP